MPRNVLVGKRCHHLLMVIALCRFPPMSPLSKETVIAGHPCRIWHPYQQNFCKRCASHGHHTVDVDICESYEADCVVAAYRADRYPLSNYYMSNITHADMNYKSVEHYYQSEFCHHCGRDDVAQQMYDAPTPRQSKCQSWRGH